MRHIGFVGISVIAAIAPCDAFASEYRLTIDSSGPQTSRYIAGAAMITDDTPQTTVVLASSDRSVSKQIDLIVSVLNKGDASFDFGPENMQIKLDDGAAYPMLTYDALMEQQRKHEARQRFAMAMAVMGRSMQASQAGNQYGTVSYSGQSFGSVGGTPYSGTTYGTGTYSGYNAAAANAAINQANSENARDIAMIKARQAQEREQIGGVLRTNTLDPNRSVSGVVKFAIPKAVQREKAPVPVTIEIRSGAEVHIFKGRIAKD